MAAFDPADPGFEARVRNSFARQTIMELIGAELTRVAPGLVEIELPYRDSLFPADASVLTTEYKINLLAPAAGERLRAVGRVVKPGRTLTICDVEVFALEDGAEKLCAKLLQTLMTMHGKSDQKQD
jgi:acyl-coenzyme A thioesterase PaaI-like protein